MIGGAAPEENQSGKPVIGARNVISGNNRGVRLEGPSAAGNAVLENLIGTDLMGTVRLGNSIDGVIVTGLTSNNRIGGLAAGEGNRIVFNHGNDVLIESGVGNAMLSNLIYANTRLAIDPGGDGSTPNDPGDFDDGANRLQNFPSLTAAISDAISTTVQGTFQSAPSSRFIIQIFTSDFTNSMNMGEGQILLGATLVETDGAGNASIRVTFPNTVPTGRFMTATATSTSATPPSSRTSSSRPRFRSSSP